MSVDFFTIFLWFFIYSFLGWLYESFICSIPKRRFINRGFLNGPYCPIYGFGALLFIWLSSLTINPIALFFLGGTTACLLEYFTSYVMEKIFHARWWDYRQRFLNLNGRVCFSGFVIFGLFSAIMPTIHHHISAFIAASPPNLTAPLSFILAAVMLADLYSTTQSFKHLNDALRAYQKALNQHTTDAIDLIRRSKRSFELQFANQKNAAKKVLTFQQRRLLAAFPSLKSLNYTDALNFLRELNRSTKASKTIKKSKKSSKIHKQRSKTASKTTGSR